MNFDFWRVTPKKRSIGLRRKKGVLFSNPGLTGWTIYYIGSFLFLFSVLFLLYLYFPVGTSYLGYFINIKSKPTKEQQAILAKSNTVIEKQAVKANYFGIQIPKINATSMIAENVSPFDSQQYVGILNEGKIAQANTSSLPGAGKGSMTYLFAHSSQESLTTSRSNAVFYLLGELSKGDSVWVEHNGTRYLYKVYDKKIIKADDIQYLHYSDPSKEVLILQTCWPVGTNWNRLLIFSELMAY